jgi:hypothetical protein
MRLKCPNRLATRRMTAAAAAVSAVEHPGPEFAFEIRLHLEEFEAEHPRVNDEHVGVAEGRGDRSKSSSAARQHAAATASAVEWALRIIREMPRWQGAFAWGHLPSRVWDARSRDG